MAVGIAVGWDIFGARTWPVLRRLGAAFVQTSVAVSVLSGHMELARETRWVSYLIQGVLLFAAAVVMFFWPKQRRTQATIAQR
jgi:hypothetical protein